MKIFKGYKDATSGNTLNPSGTALGMVFLDFSKPGRLPITNFLGYRYDYKTIRLTVIL